MNNVAVSALQVTNELLNADRPALAPPTNIHYAEKHVSIHFRGMNVPHDICFSLRSSSNCERTCTRRAR